MTEHHYDDGFYDYINAGSTTSAHRTLPFVRQAVQVSSVLDVGCGQGAWLAQWRAIGVDDVVGVDGSYVSRERVLIPSDRFVSTDLAKRLQLGRRFDLVESLEVAEHLPETSSEDFVDGLVHHGDVIMFSAAVPGQGGEFHVNEQPLDYWRQKFERRGYSAFDAIRPRILKDRAIEPWYRYNVLLYANEVGQARMSPDALATIVKGGTITDVSPLGWRMRNKILATLPRPAIESLAQMKHAIVRGSHRIKS